ncbi:autoinducer binding domain-containing protein (plasmid) [Bradyrhizobium barranii]|uniref:Autoinducer binding domain-containing protein n=1 Tax=Bradyrhizobium barranii TaxID=2992140 RepID=A0ABY3R1L8_9BRAD|nr:autoinducer binding domain-containing protein [Bradyrhizobium japonicum]UFW92134.1 autoinducer binding domain-containing protein [Bradyrhizobium japonicum]
MDGQLQALMEAVDVARDERSNRNTIEKFTVSSGFDRYVYSHIHGDDAVVFSDYPTEWLNLYFAKRYTIIDPVVTTAKRSMRMFAWSAEEHKVRRSSREIKQFVSEATDFGLRSGVSVPIRTSYGRAAMIEMDRGFGTRG